MTIDEYAETHVNLGEKIVKVGEVYWRRVRPFFFRPMLPYIAYEKEEIVSPCNRLSKCLGGYQHVVTSQGKANSTMKFLIFDRIHEYGLDKLKYENRRVIKKASQQFEILPLVDIGEFIDQGYQAYLSFHGRTGYFYKPERTQKERFAEWADAIIKSKALVLGGYGKDGLVAVSIAYHVEQTFIYATFFSDTESLHKGIGELMLHKIRETAMQQSDIMEIFAGGYHGGTSLDKYYTLRGCKIAEKPANLHIHSGTHLFMRICLPQQYAMLCGRY